MKLDKCPTCSSTYLNDIWQTGRRLQQSCCACNWRGPVRTPELRKIETTRKLHSRSGGWTYEIYDGFGYPIIASQSYMDRETARTKMQNYLESAPEYYGNCTGIIWPPSAIISGEVFTKDGPVAQPEERLQDIQEAAVSTPAGPAE